MSSYVLKHIRNAAYYFSHILVVIIVQQNLGMQPNFQQQPVRPNIWYSLLCLLHGRSYLSHLLLLIVHCFSWSVSSSFISTSRICLPLSFLLVPWRVRDSKVGHQRYNRWESSETEDIDVSLVRVCQDSTGADVSWPTDQPSGMNMEQASKVDDSPKLSLPEEISAWLISFLVQPFLWNYIGDHQRQYVLFLLLFCLSMILKQIDVWKEGTSTEKIFLISIFYQIVFGRRQGGLLFYLFDFFVDSFTKDPPEKTFHQLRWQIFVNFFCTFLRDCCWQETGRR